MSSDHRHPSDRCERCVNHEVCDQIRQVGAATLKSCREYDPTTTEDDVQLVLTMAVETLGEAGCAFPLGAIYRQIVAQAANPETPSLFALDLPWDEIDER